jgi:hypothetical protein
MCLVCINLFSNRGRGEYVCCFYVSALGLGIVWMCPLPGLGDCCDTDCGCARSESIDLTVISPRNVGPSPENRPLFLLLCCGPPSRNIEGLCQSVQVWTLLLHDHAPMSHECS